MPILHDQDTPLLVRYPASLSSAAAALWGYGGVTPSVRRLADALTKPVGAFRK